MPFSGGFHGPPELDQPLQFGRQSSSPRRRASLAAWPIASNQAGVLKATGPGGISQPASKICAPPRPIAAIASRSAVIPAFVTFPFIQCHQVWGLASCGGERKPSSSDAASAKKPKAAQTDAIPRTILLFIGFLHRWVCPIFALTPGKPPSNLGVSSLADALSSKRQKDARFSTTTIRPGSLRSTPWKVS